MSTDVLKSAYGSFFCPCVGNFTLKTVLAGRDVGKRFADDLQPLRLSDVDVIKCLLK